MSEPSRGRVAAAYARGVAALRWVIVAAWVAGAAAATIWLPPVQTGGGYDLSGLLPKHSVAIATEQRLLGDFPFPLTSDVVVVARNSGGLDPLTQLDTVLYALTFDQRLSHLHTPLPDDRVLGAMPVLNTARLFPGSKESGTTAATYLFFSPTTSLGDRVDLAHRYARHFGPPVDAQVLVTGTTPARVRQGSIVVDHLQLVEIATLVFVSLVVALAFRSLVAPLVTLAAAFLSYLVAVRLLGQLAHGQDVQLPALLEPLLVALVLGILTDYSVFFFTEMRDRMHSDDSPREALRLSLRHNIPIVAVAGLTVTVGTGSLAVSSLHMFRAFGPALAVSVLVGALAATTFVPAAIAILGRRIYWPSHPERAGPQHAVAPAERPTRWPVRFISTRPGAALASVLCLAALLAAAWPLLHTRLDASFIRSLPADSTERRGADLVSAGLPRGVLGPAQLLVRAPTIDGPSAQLSRLQQEVARQPGVAGVVGPGSVPVDVGHGIFVSPKEPEARMLVFFDDDPLSGDGIGDLRALQASLPRLLRSAGLDRAQASVGGDTAIASEASHTTVVNLWLVVGVAFAAEFVILALFLRALLAPLMLLGASALVVASALGLATWVFQDNLSSGGLTFYVPFAVSVLLISLGSDYNVFAVGRIWQASRNRRLRRAIRRALPESSKAITTAGIALAGSFALVALIPLLPFREMAFTIVAGLVIDTFIVRSVLTPGLLTLVGRAAGWPGNRLDDPEEQQS